MSVLYLVRPSEEWTRSAAFSATSALPKHPAMKAGNDDPGDPWIAASGTATLTVDLGTEREVSVIALVTTNATIPVLVQGDVTGTLTAESGWTLVLPSPVPARIVTLSILGNPDPWAVGRVVIGKRRELRGSPPTDMRAGRKVDLLQPQYSDKNDFGHDIRYHLGVETWAEEGRFVLTKSGAQELEDWWRSTKAGFLPTLIQHEGEPSRWVRFTMGFPKVYDHTRLFIEMRFEEVVTELNVF